MARPAPTPRLPREFNDFLFAQIVDDRNGMPLTVVSALARLDVDPWQEAAELAGLPSDTAIQRLASMIARLPDGPSAPPDAATIAGRLIALLPRSPVPVGANVVEVRGKNDLLVVISLGMMIFILSTQLFMALQRPTARDKEKNSPASGAIFVQSAASRSAAEDQMR